MNRNKNKSAKIRIRKTDKDVFSARHLASADFDTGFYQIPKVPDAIIDKPIGLVIWSRRKSCQEKSRFGLCFYEYDCMFDGFKGIFNVLKYGDEKEISELIKELKEFAFVICPDYSVYGNFPNYKQIDAMARSREVGCMLSAYGVKVVVNYRASYEWTYELALTGFCEHPIVAVGTLGSIRDYDTRKMLKNSIDALVLFVKPRVIIVYGSAPFEVFRKAIEFGIDIWQFDSRISLACKGVSGR